MTDDKSRLFVLWTGPITAFVVFLLFAPVAVALLLPAIQSVRETRQRDRTAHNLRQLGLALANYQETRVTSSSNAPADALLPADRPMNEPASQP